MATQDTTVKAFVGLPIEDLICAPIIGAAKGQRALAQETLSFVNDLAFLPKDNDDGSKNANIIDVSLDRLTNSSTTGEVAHVNQKIQMPMISLVNIPVITLVPHNGMAIKEVEIDMKVALSPGESKEINKSDVTKKKPSRIRSFLTDLSNRNKGHEMAKIKVKFNGQDAPEGIARIKDSLIKIIPN